MAPPQLNFDMISNILNIRMNAKKDDRYKNNFNKCIKNIPLLFQMVDDDIGNMVDDDGCVMAYTIEMAEHF